MKTPIQHFSLVTENFRKSMVKRIFLQSFKETFSPNLCSWRWRQEPSLSSFRIQFSRHPPNTFIYILWKIRVNEWTFIYIQQLWDAHLSVATRWLAPIHFMNSITRKVLRTVETGMCSVWTTFMFFVFLKGKANSL